MTARTVAAIALAFVCAAGAACGKDKTSSGQDRAEPEAARPFTPRDVTNLATPDFFALIPADSPFVVAGFEPTPRVFVEKIAEALAPLAGLIEIGVQEGMRETDHPALRALLGEIEGKLSIEGLESLGFKANPRFAGYMIGTSLAIRIELTSGKKLEGALARIEQAGDIGARKGTLEGIGYRAWIDGDMEIVAAVIGDELVIGVMHEAAVSAVLPTLFGVKKPDKSIADTGALKDLVAQYGYLGVSPGYFDLRLLARMFTGEASEVSQQVVAATGLPAVGTSDACKQEISELSEIAPRLVFGYTALDGKGAESVSLLELRKDVARDLAGLQAPVPGLATIGDSNPLFAMGMGLDLGKTLDWTRARARAVAAKPYRCEWLQWINEGATEIAGGLDAPLPPTVSGFKGFVMVLQDLKLGGMMPTGSGYALVGMDDPMQLIELAKGMIPQLASVKPSSDGTPVKVDLGLPGLGDTHLAVKGSWLGISVGPGMADRIAKLVRTTPAAGGPFMVVAYDYGRYMELLGSMMDMGAPGMDMQGAMKGLIDLFGLMRTDLYLSGDGVVMKYVMKFR